jgi:hypothetical protein
MCILFSLLKDYIIIAVTHDFTNLIKALMTMKLL